VIPHSERGFTLLELILALVLTGLLVAMVGSGVVSGFNLFAVARDNTHITQKANLALTRLTRELREITDVVAVNTTIPYLIYQQADTTSAIALDGSTIKLFSDVAVSTMDSAYIATNGDILIDGITAFDLTYFSNHSSANDTTNTWQTSPTFDPIRELSAIQFQLTMGRDTLGGRTSSFGNTVHLRNNNNYGGLVPTVTPPSPPTRNSYPCFIKTAGAAKMGGQWWPIMATAFGLLSLFRLPWRQIQRCCAFICSQRSMMSDARGAALIAAVVVLVVFSALAIIMLPMITTSQYTQLGQDTTAKTYFLAESGYRYAASQYLNAGSDTAKNIALENLHGQNFSLAGNAGSFQLDVYPYYGYVESDPAGSSTLRVKMPGGLSTDLVDTGLTGSGRLQIGRTAFSYTAADTSSPPVVSFTMSATMPTIPVNTNVYFLARSAGGQTVTQGGTITMTSGSTRAFPLRNAEVVIHENVYAYRQNDRTGNQLIGISDPEDPNMAAWILPANTDVILSRFVELQSTGSHGSGALASQRLLTYQVPLPNSEYSRQRQEFHDRFDDLSHWANIWGGQAVAEIGGDNAMEITGTADVGVFPRISLTALDWTTTELDLELIHQRADYFLSYDAQVKIGFRGSPTPEGGFTPVGSNIPTYFAAGLSFRLDAAAAAHNAYGLSLMRGDNTAPFPYDNLPNQILDTSFNDKLVILLWQLTNSGSSVTWLAYKEIDDLTQFEEDVESGFNGWTADGLWDISPNRSTSGTNSWYYGQDATTNYDTGAINAGSLVSPEIDLDICDYSRLMLKFWSWHQTQPTNPDSYDLKTVGIRTRLTGGAWSEWVEIDRLSGASSGWVERQVDLTPYFGESVQLRFHFDTVSALDNAYEGWYLDDIRITGDWPVQEATLALRVQEAPSLRFTNGGTYAIQMGDQIYQSTASAIVDAVPVLTSGNWGAGTAAGHLILKNLSGSFNLSQRFSVIGQGEVGTAQEVRARDNFIRAYYGSPDGCGTPNTDPFDNERSANPRDPTELNWPPAEGDPYTAADDAFTLIQWDTDKIHSAVSSFSRLTATQLRSNESVLLTPNGPLGQTRPELGLHAMGKGAENTYFDDFGLTVTFDGPVDVTAPIQE
jgi:prepilin-type N-terminal cleavage/methylation domain-containing protein